MTSTRTLGGTWLSEVYGLVKLTPSLASILVTMMRIRTSTSQWHHSWSGGKRSRKTSTVRTVTTNRKKNAVCYLSGQNTRKGSPRRYLSIEASHGREKKRTLLFWGETSTTKLNQSPIATNASQDLFLLEIKLRGQLVTNELFGGVDDVTGNVDLPCQLVGMLSC